MTAPSRATAPDRPRVSVCVPVYNGAPYIAECVESVLAQSFEDFELIVCDNCSTDDTEKIVRRYDDVRVRYVRNARNLGLVGNANRCLELAAGQYLCIFHHDDVMLRENLARKVAVLDAHPGVGLVHSNVHLIDPRGAVVAQDIWAEDSRRDYVEPGLNVLRTFLKCIPYASTIFIGAVLARRASYERLGGFRDELPHCSDSEMWMRMALFFDVACIGQPLVQYRVHPTSTSATWGDNASWPYLREHYLAVTLLFDRYRDHIPERRRLFRTVARAFASRAVEVASADLVAGRTKSGRSTLRRAVRMHTPIAATLPFVRAAVASVAGPDGIRIYRRIKAIGKPV